MREFHHNFHVGVTILMETDPYTMENIKYSNRNRLVETWSSPFEAPKMLIQKNKEKYDQNHTFNYGYFNYIREV